MPEVMWLPTASRVKAQPAIVGLQLATRSLPGRNAALDHGDFYDVQPLRPGRWGLAVGAMRVATSQDIWPPQRPIALRSSALHVMAEHTPDVGTSTACAIMRAMAYIEDRPSRVLAGLNRAFLACAPSDSCLLSVTYAAVRPTSAGTFVRICAAGQPPPFVLRAGGSVAALGTSGPPLGLRPDPQLHDARLLLRAGDSLILLTENVTQATGRGSTPFGAGRLGQILAGLGGASAARSVGAILREVRAFCGGQVEHETVALVMRVPGKSRRRDSNSARWVMTLADPAPDRPAAWPSRRLRVRSPRLRRPGLHPG